MHLQNCNTVYIMCAKKKQQYCNCKKIIGHIKEHKIITSEHDKIRLKRVHKNASKIC